MTKTEKCHIFGCPDSSKWTPLYNFPKHFYTIFPIWNNLRDMQCSSIQTLWPFVMNKWLAKSLSLFIVPSWFCNIWGISVTLRCRCDRRQSDRVFPIISPVWNILYFPYLYSFVSVFQYSPTFSAPAKTVFFKVLWVKFLDWTIFQDYVLQWPCRGAQMIHYSLCLLWNCIWQ